MKLNKNINILLIIIIISLNNFIMANSFSAVSIMDSMLKVIHPISSKVIIAQEIISAGNIKRDFILNYFSNNYNDNILIKFLEPENIKNSAFLIKREDIFVYLINTKRIRKLSDYAKMNKSHGSDFLYEHFIESKKWNKNYNIKLGDSYSRENYLLVLDSKDDMKTFFSTIKIYIDKLNYYPVRIQYFNHGVNIQTLVASNIVNIQGIPTPKIKIMTNHLHGSQTKMQLLDIEYYIKYEDNFFNKNSLIQYEN